MQKTLLLSVLAVLFCCWPQSALTSQIPPAGTVAMVDLGAKSCIPCKMMAPILAELKEEYRGRAAVIFIDIWENPDAARRFGVQVIPTQIFYDREGREVYRHVGFLDRAPIVERLESLLAGESSPKPMAEPSTVEGDSPVGLPEWAAGVFGEINRWLTGSLLLALAGSFLWGVVSVLFSPCHLASIPLIIAYVGGQQQILSGRQAARYALLFSLGLFLTIAMVGVICVLLGRMLGDVGPYWTILVGLILLWLAADMLGVAKCALPGGTTLAKLKIEGGVGALVLGLAYGVLSGSCTFGFIAPLLAVVAVQGEVAAGIALILVYALGHCLPIALAGGSSAKIKRLIETGSMQQGSVWVRRVAGVIMLALGLYFILRPFLGV